MYAVLTVVFPSKNLKDMLFFSMKKQNKGKSKASVLRELHKLH